MLLVVVALPPLPMYPGGRTVLFPAVEVWYSWLCAGSEEGRIFRRCTDKRWFWRRPVLTLFGRELVGVQTVVLRGHAHLIQGLMGIPDLGIQHICQRVAGISLQGGGPATGGGCIGGVTGGGFTGCGCTGGDGGAGVFWRLCLTIRRMNMPTTIKISSNINLRFVVRR